MIQLDEKTFSTLLTDFYAVFAPQKLLGVPNIVEKYKNSSLEQRNAIQTAYVIYFQNSNPNYKNNYKYFANTLPEVGTETNIMKLMESYSRGERICSPDIIEKHLKSLEDVRQKTEEEKQKKEKEESQKNLEVDALKKQVEQLNQEIENKKEQPTQIVQQTSIFEEMEVEITSFSESYQDSNGKVIYREVDISNINMPDKKYFATLCINQRLILSNKEGSIIGVEVSNIYDDYISREDGKPIRILELKKV